MFLKQTLNRCGYFSAIHHTVIEQRMKPVSVGAALVDTGLVWFGIVACFPEVELVETAVLCRL